jgi:hypothetical protein
VCACMSVFCFDFDGFRHCYVRYRKILVTTKEDESEEKNC